MTEFSFPWGCTATGDGGPASYSLEIVEKTNRYLSNVDPVNDGVIYWTQAPYTGLLGATNPAGDIVRIASGLGLVEGWLYENDADVDFDVGAGNANATDLIVLRRSNPGVLPQTVRLVHIQGPPAGTATVTQTAAVWEVALWEVQLDGAGNFSALVDVRKTVTTPTGSKIKIAEFIADGVTQNVDWQNLPDIFSHLQIVYSFRGLAGGLLTNASIRFNGDGAANYEQIIDDLNETTVYNGIFLLAQNEVIVLSLIANGAPAGYASQGIVEIPNYTSPFYKMAMSSQHLNDGGGVGTGAGWERRFAHGTWLNTAIINRIQIINGQIPAIGSIFTLYAQS